MPSLELKFHLHTALLYVAAYIAQFASILAKPFLGRPFRLSPFTVRMLTMHRFFNVDKAANRLHYRPLRAFDEAWHEAIAGARDLLVADGAITKETAQRGAALVAAGQAGGAVEADTTTTATSVKQAHAPRAQSTPRVKAAK